MLGHGHEHVHLHNITYYKKTDIHGQENQILR